MASSEHQPPRGRSVVCSIGEHVKCDGNAPNGPAGVGNPCACACHVDHQSPRLVVEPPPGARLILASEDLLERIGTRSNDGYRITGEWGDQRPEGWYEPTFVIHYDQPFPGHELAGHRTDEPHGCLAMDCRGLGGEVAELRAALLRWTLADSLVEVWKAVEAALPAGWSFWQVTAYAPDEERPASVYARVRTANTIDGHGNVPEVSGSAATLEEALRILRAVLLTGQTDG